MRGHSIIFHSSQLTAHSSQLTAHSSQLTAHSSQLTAHSSQLTSGMSYGRNLPSQLCAQSRSNHYLSSQNSKFCTIALRSTRVSLPDRLGVRVSNCACRRENLRGQALSLHAPFCCGRRLAKGGVP